MKKIKLLSLFWIMFLAVNAPSFLHAGSICCKPLHMPQDPKLPPITPPAQPQITSTLPMPSATTSAASSSTPTETCAPKRSGFCPLCNKRVMDNERAMEEQIFATTNSLQLTDLEKRAVNAELQLTLIFLILDNRVPHASCFQALLNQKFHEYRP